IQNPDAKSPLFSSWQNIKVEKVDVKTVRFTLSNSLNAFPASLTTGIVPRHMLSDVPTVELRTARFNNVNPVGAGPFKWETVQVEGDRPENREVQVGLVPFEQYNGGRPQLQRFIIHSFNDKQQLIKSFRDQEISAISGLDEMPPELSGN